MTLTGQDRDYIFKLVNDHLDWLQENAQDNLKHEGINWGDLSCRSIRVVEEYMSVGLPDEFIEILIEEASETAFELQRQIQAHVRQNTSNDHIIYVRTEW